MYALRQYGVTGLWETLNSLPFGFVPQLLYIVSNLTIDKKLVTLVMALLSVD